MRLDAKPEHSIRWKHSIVNLDCVSEVQVVTLWAVGSYARGALDCCDLDLVADILILKGQPPPPPDYEVAKAIIHRAKGISVHIGTPQVNSSGVTFDESKLIWQGPGCRWRGAVDAIMAEPSAGHFPRPIDRIPFRSNQLRCDLDDLERLLDLVDRKMIQWTFTPMGVAPDVGDLSQHELELSEAVDWFCGRKTRLLLPHLIAHLRGNGGWTKPYLRAHFDKMVMGIGGTKVALGRPNVPTHELDWLTTSELLVVPHISASGPNGIWSIERGEQHPFVLAASELRVYALFGADDQPEFYCRLDKDCDDGRCDASSARGIDLFTSLRSARKWNKEGIKDGEPDLVAKRLSPRELLSCLSRVDIASINLTDFAMTHCGRLALAHDNLASSQVVLDALAV
jgi:hypothetical protein